MNKIEQGLSAENPLFFADLAGIHGVYMGIPFFAERYVKEDLIIPHNVSFYELIKATSPWCRAFVA